MNSITLYFLGGVSETAEEAHTPEAELRMAAAGPLTSIVLGVVFYAIFVLGGGLLPLAVVAVLEYAGYINIVLAAFNLIPAFPMDGGRVLRGIVWGRNKDVLKSTRTVTNVSRCHQLPLHRPRLPRHHLLRRLQRHLATLHRPLRQSSATASMNETRVTQALTGVTVGEMMTKDVKTVEPDLTLQQVQDYALTPLKHHGFPVVKDGELLGLVTDEDVRKVEARALGREARGDSDEEDEEPRHGEVRTTPRSTP